jgi:DNA-binding NarL/FixJ family response regulator
MKDEIKRLILADDHHLLRRGFKSLLSGEPDLEVVARLRTASRPSKCAVAWSPTSS